uniref:Uncharacterized protein n=1 Tax=Rhizophora mucronata TaxID=61149 RepID=A0A2P2NDR3_RHIMU
MLAIMSFFLIYMHLWGDGKM